MRERFYFGLTILLFLLLPAQGRPKPHYTFILPDGYVGWLQVIFNDPQASALVVQRNGGRVIQVPESGICRTSNLRVHDEGKDEFYYLSVLPAGKAETRSVPSELVLPGIDHGGFGVAETGGKGPGYSWYLFIGPPGLRAKVPDADWDKVVDEYAKTHGGRTRIESSGPYPIPGRMPSGALR